ncbi:hypothetical protein EXE58_08940 [Nocardioides seonyuensis]|uniref:Uncharacterized protein n=1 Tax=Nocardioides seonyuensis TaxID=2518371 RepID=A0A4P7IEB2_9ACTN|nr:hypothetical protein [Nocardioides seonyuensis]QBX55565.1 hypothetical protein EXE58_08940 [Nocardioides seonyuensis]
MPSSTDGQPVRGTSDPWPAAARDLGHLVAFRARTVRRRGAALAGSALVLGVTVAFATLPSRSRSVTDGIFADVLQTSVRGLEGNLPLGFAAVLLLGVAASMAGGGGRELLSRTEAMVHPISPVTEHLGALVLTPLNMAWLIQAWGLLAATAMVTPPERTAGAQVVTVLWLLVAAALGQAVGWAVEGVRRTTHGVVLVRAATIALGLVAMLLHLAGRLEDIGRALPTTWLVDTAATSRWPLPALVLLALLPAAVWLGAWPARWALGLPPREELRVDSDVHEARHAPQPRWLSADLAMLRRLDRGSVWRSVGMRRGLVILGLGPGLVVLVAGLEWTSILLLPGLGVSGAALLFGVNAWCLDGKGMVWRETLPVPAAVAFDARALVVAECLVAVSGLTLFVALVRTGLPGPTTAVAVVTCWLVVVVQVLATSMRWSVRSPYSVDLSSPRATPAPHAAMAGYAGRLSLSTTLTGILFAAFAVLPAWWVSLAFAPLFLTWSGVRLVRARRQWLEPTERARIVLTAAAV